MDNNEIFRKFFREPNKIVIGGMEMDVIFNDHYSGDTRRYITSCTIVTTQGVYSGSAICSPRDTHDRKFGLKLAYRRACLDMFRQAGIRNPSREELKTMRLARWQAMEGKDYIPPMRSKVETTEPTAAEIAADVEQLR